MLLEKGVTNLSRCDHHGGEWKNFEVVYMLEQWFSCLKSVHARVQNIHVNLHRTSERISVLNSTLLVWL